ncbi:hypothetical protein H181DRAFT_03877 [Streptomyces sp. WMMB 714]|uniref:hypothetical protein n=1 Tax=Streptomyces sp. WMMB 714 TaxID=1286822 RepID=UPI000823DE14|nr:hypothetical protein [Streptomyces sp. WMMB 714]SCK44046.1 hypothetical protein H181DRAFT_03877 [Streptomyces sp. WMMB 714]
MMVLAEFLTNFFPRRPGSFREYVISCLFTVVVSVLVWVAVARFYGAGPDTVVHVSWVLAAFETAAYAVSWFVFRHRAGGEGEA